MCGSVRGSGRSVPLAHRKCPVYSGMGVMKHRDTQCPLPFPGFPVWNVFLTQLAAGHLWAGAGQKTAVRVSSASLPFEEQCSARMWWWKRQKWEVQYVVNLFSLPLLNNGGQLWGVLCVQNSRYWVTWTGEIEVRTIYFPTGFFGSGCPLRAITSVTKSVSSRVSTSGCLVHCEGPYCFFD